MPESNQMQSVFQYSSAHMTRVRNMMLKIREHAKAPNLPCEPCIPPPIMLEKQAKLIMEEVLELFEACNITCLHRHLDIPIKKEDFDYVCETPVHPDKLPEAIKEIADVTVVTTGMFVEFGVADTPVLTAVDLNNLAKFGSGGYVDENLKWRKPPNHPKPDIKKILTELGWKPGELKDECEKDQKNLPSPSNDQG